VDQVELALTIATEAHKGQFRWDKKTPFIEHPIAVAKLVKEYLNTGKWMEGAEDLLISAAYLHDVIEDSNMDAEKLLDKGVRLEIEIS